MRVPIATFAVVLAVAAPAQAEDTRVDRLDLIESGFYETDAATVVGAIPSPGAAAGKTVTLGDVHLAPEPPATGAHVGIGFGVRFRARGEPAGARVVLRSVWRIPEPGIHNPNNGNTYRESVADFAAVVGEPHMRGYQFDQPWEVVAGTWTIEIWQGDRKLLEHSFAVQ
ncbi:MAG TPA: DUF3859 domain-containing protein [Xanthobacteraceae bacterium]|nr:DUF3859 domain-containing protein [Xanthobacteraceae bacterium]